MLNKLTRVLFTSDLHGSNLHFRKLLETAIANNVDALIIGGDISGKSMTPVFEVSAGVYEAELVGRKERARAGDELARLEEDIASSGSYPVRLGTELEYSLMQADAGRRDAVFLGKMKDRLECWLRLAEEKLQPKRIRFLVMCGNDDRWELDEVVKAFPFAENPDQGVIKIGWHEIIGESGANETPFHCPRDMKEPLLEARIRAKVAMLEDEGRAIFVFHVPPFDSGLDSAPALDSNLGIVTSGGHAVITPAGSTAVRKIIEECQPVLSLHGHIHESPGFVRLGRTLCVNPGSEYPQGIMRAVLVTLDRDSVRSKIMITR
jgi:Icc-related predicted phosphoesterase